MQKYFKSKHSITFILNNKVSQISFADKSELIYSEIDNTFVYLGKKE